MRTECNPTSMRFARLKGRDVVADFGGGTMTSDAGALLLGATDRAIGLVERFSDCFSDGRAADRVVHDVETLVGQRVFGIALGYEDVVDHDELRHDPVLGAVLGRLEARRRGYAPLAGKSTLNRLEHAPAGAHRYRRIGHDAGAIEALFVDLFLDAHEDAPERLVLDLDATDDPLHGRQEGRFFHGYYDCYCYLPLYIFCGDHLLAAKLRRANIDASAGAVEEVERIVGRIRARWPAVEIVLRADSGFAREPLMAWCEDNRRRLCLRPGAQQAAHGPPAAGPGPGRGALAGERRACAPVYRVPLSHAEDMVPPTPGRRQGGVAAWRRQPALHRHFAGPGRHRPAGPLRTALLRPRRDGKPHQGVPTRPVRRPHLHRHHARQPTPPLVRLHGLCPALRPEAHRARRNPPRQSHMRLHPTQAPQDRRPGPAQRKAYPHRHGVRLPPCQYLRPGSPTIMQLT